MIKIFLFEHDKLNTFPEADIKNAFGFGKAETERLSSIKNEKRFLESACALAALGQLLDKCYDGARDNILRSDSGKPYFENAPLSLSLSHSGNVSVAAVCDDKECDIGIDIEIISPRKNLLELAKRFFSPEEMSEFTDNNSSERSFFNIWTKKEAYAKMTGEGLSSVINSNRNNVSVNLLCFEIYNNSNAYSLSCATSQKISNVDFYNNLSNIKIIKSL